MKKVLIVGLAALFALTACARPEPINAQDIMDERAKYRATAAPEPEQPVSWDISEGYQKIFPQIEEALLAQYDIDTLRAVEVENKIDKQRWLESFVSYRLDPAILQVSGDNGEWYEYQVVLWEGEVVLKPLHDEEHHAPSPETLVEGE